MMFREAKLVVLALFHTFLLAICAANGNQACRPSSCGDIQNISYPFRLKGDPSGVVIITMNWSAKTIVLRSNVTSSSSQAYVYALVGDFTWRFARSAASGVDLSFLSFRCKSECEVKGLDCDGIIAIIPYSAPNL
ncbi:hypothetical protein CK203_099781 [Vitis vinifera]|uniref:Uncharacterized protein n=1 Tax=Vitis vinifera TaxID=29760 RepID=A0A438C6X6_VITVI|nr:hypothetical protein CK203_099781 [Vitis vinifera]